MSDRAFGDTNGEVLRGLVEGLQDKWGDLPWAERESIVLEGYRSGALTHSQVRRLLGFSSRNDVDGFLKQHEIYLEYTLDDLEKDLENSRRARL